MGVLEETFPQNLNVMSTSSLSSFGHVVTTTKTKIWSMCFTNINAATRYVRLYNTSSTVDPVTYTAVFRAAVPAGTSFTWYADDPIQFSDGLTVVATSTAGEATGGTPTAGNVFAFIQYS